MALYFSNFDVQVRATMRATGADEEEEEVAEEVLPDLLEVQTFLLLPYKFCDFGATVCVLIAKILILSNRWRRRSLRSLGILSTTRAVALRSRNVYTFLTKVVEIGRIRKLRSVVWQTMRCEGSSQRFLRSHRRTMILMTYYRRR